MEGAPARIPVPALGPPGHGGRAGVAGLHIAGLLLRDAENRDLAPGDVILVGATSEAVMRPLRTITAPSWIGEAARKMLLIVHGNPF